jgi:3-isopropylmalate dehydrogenase
MLRWSGDRNSDPRLVATADRLEGAIARVLKDGRAQTYDQGGSVTTSGAGDLLATAIREDGR